MTARLHWIIYWQAIATLVFGGGLAAVALKYFFPAFAVILSAYAIALAAVFL